MGEGLTIGSLFSGIGGLELGLEWAGLGPTLWQVEREPFCRAVLAHHWPNAERFDDVRSVGKASLAPVDIICGGFPCQDVSSAGKGAGLAGERSGLWREFARILGELQPRWVVVENVTSGARKWLDEVVRELEQLGYACLPLPLSASDCGAPHRRSRIFIVAHADGGRELQPQGSESEQWGRVENSAGNAANADGDIVRVEQWRSETGTPPVLAAVDGEVGTVADADDARREGPGPGVEVQGWRDRSSANPWRSPQSGLVPLVHGLPGGLVGRRRRARIRALGNSVVPQCAETVGWVIRELIAQAGQASHV